MGTIFDLDIPDEEITINSPKTSHIFSQFKPMTADDQKTRQAEMMKSGFFVGTHSLVHGDLSGYQVDENSVTNYNGEDIQFTLHEEVTERRNKSQMQPNTLRISGLDTSGKVQNKGLNINLS